MPSPGWYADPAGRHQLRWWDGGRWTDGVATAGVATRELAAPYSGATRQVSSPYAGAAGTTAVSRAAVFAGGGSVALADRAPVPAGITLPGRAALLGLLGVVLGAALSVAGGLLGRLVAPGTVAVRLVLGQFGLWAGLLAVCWIASRWYGTGRVGRDFGVRFRPLDLPVGFAAALAGRILLALLVLPLVAVDRRLVGTNTGVFSALRSDRTALIILALFASVGAPLVEELFFRGLLLRSFEPRIGGVGAVLAQALLFGCAHANPTSGWQNVSVIGSTALLGVLLGLLARHYRRLGPGMATHCMFNLGTVLALLLI